VFLGMIGWPVGCQVSDQRNPAVFSAFSDDFQQVGFHKALKLLESRLERRGVFQDTVRLPYREFLFRALDKTTDNTCLGRDGFLFYRDDVRFQWSPGPLSTHQAARIAESEDVRGDAFEEWVRAGYRRLLGQPAPVLPSPAPHVDASTAILTTIRQLKARGLQVLVVPLPGKLAIYPEFFGPGYPLARGPAMNRDLERWMELLRADGVNVVDVFHPLWEAKRQRADFLYLKTDSHWAPSGLAVTTDAIARAAEGILGKASASPFVPEEKVVEHSGDQRLLLDLEKSFRYYPTETITVTRVANADNKDLSGDAAPVLLLGDSYTTTYQQHGAGLPEQLMLRLGRGVQTIAAPGTTPAVNLHQLNARPEALARKKLVIWTFVDRMLNRVDAWESVQLRSP
jgi:alginate O-acetyltransferase complex protein AlgJ